MIGTTTHLTRRITRQLSAFGNRRVLSSSAATIESPSYLDETAEGDEIISDPPPLYDDHGLHPVLRTSREQNTLDHLTFDRNHLWHPYTSMVDPIPALPVARAEGCTIHLEDGSTMLDGMSSWWSTVFGYNHPVLNQALHDQVEKMSHVMFGGLTHRPATELASMLLHQLNLPRSSRGSGTTTNGDTNHHRWFDKIFYTDSGSVAVEVALKMALQYHRGVHPNNRKTEIVSVRGGYHGDTLGAMSVCDPVNGMHTAFRQALPRHVRHVQRPPHDTDYSLSASAAAIEDHEEELLQAALKDLQDTLAAHHDTIAALILEPLVQGAGGMRFYSPRYLQRARELCTAHDVLLICDEIATGFGRSGALFASVHVKPDIICLGKALTGGYMTLGAVATTDRVARGVSMTPHQGSDESIPALPLMHGPTFMANPLACAVATASTNLLLSSSHHDDARPFWQVQVERIEHQLRSQLAPAAAIPGVADVRVRGAIGVLELDEPMDNHTVPYRCRELGVWVRPFGKLLYIMPPYIMTNSELERVTQAMMILADENGRSSRQ